MNRQLLLVIASIFVFIFTCSANADPFKSERVLSGVIDKVDFSRSAIVIVNDETGREESYLFDQNTKVIFAGKVVKPRELLKPGLSVQIRFPNKREELVDTGL